MHVGGVGVADGPNRPEKWTTILQSKRYGVVLKVTTPARGNRALAKVENNCWAPPQENWRPYWKRLRAQLTAWGYRIR